MKKRMLIDSTHGEETRVAIVESNKLLEYEYESKFRKPLKGSIFLAKVTRVEPSLQAAFVNFGGNRHGFLPFSEIHPDYFRIPIADREALMAEQQAALDAMDRDEEEAEAGTGGQRDGEDSAEGVSDSFAGPENFENGHGDTHNDDAEQQINPIEEIDDEDDAVEIIGGNEFVNESEHNNAQQDSGHDLQGPDRVSGFVAEDGDTLPENQIENGENGHDGDDVSSSDETGGEDGASENGRPQGRGRGRGRRNFRRGGGGGRGHGPRGAPFRSRRVESFGGEQHDESGPDPMERFRFSLRRKYKIQEVIKRGQIMLIQVSKEERGNKGAAVTSYLSLPGRYCVLMPNSPRAGGVSRKISSSQDRARMREIVRDMNVPKGMSVIVRTAGVARSQDDINRDLGYLMRLWDNIRELTLKSSAPSIVYEEADLIKRAVRDLFSKDMEELVVAGKEGFETARNYMEIMMPEQVDRVQQFGETGLPLFSKYKIEEQIADIGESQVTLPSGGYLVINQTEALVSIDVNSGRATKERHIEETAVKTNLEAASEAARQLRLRDLGGLIVIDFIDMEDRRNNARVERRMRDALSTDRARIQMGRISSFGLMELSRQRLNPSLTETQFEVCTHCNGMGRVRTADASSVMVLRAIEEEGIRRRASQVIVHVPANVAVYILNNKRRHLTDIEARYGLMAMIRPDETIGPSSFRIEPVKSVAAGEVTEGDSAEVSGDARIPPVIEGEDDQPRRSERERGRRGGQQPRRGSHPKHGERQNGRYDTQADSNHESVADVINAPDEDNDDFMPGNSIASEIDENADDIGNRRDAQTNTGHARTERNGQQRRGRRGGAGRNGAGRASRGQFREHNQRNDSSAPATPDSFSALLDDSRTVIVPERPFVPPSPVSAPVQAPPRNEKPVNEQPAHAKNFEVVNEAPREKKRGWWSKITD